MGEKRKDELGTKRKSESPESDTEKLKIENRLENTKQPFSIAFGQVGDENTDSVEIKTEPKKSEYAKKPKPEPSQKIVSK